MKQFLFFALFSVNTTAVMDQLTDGANSLKDLIMKVDKNYRDPDLDNMEKALIRIVKNFQNIKGADFNIDIVDSLTDFKDAKLRIYRLKDILDSLAKTTVRSSEQMIKMLKLFVDNMTDTSNKRRFEKAVKRMITLLKISDGALEDALYEYDKIVDRLNTVKKSVDKYKVQVEEFKKQQRRQIGCMDP